MNPHIMIHTQKSKQKPNISTYGIVRQQVNMPMIISLQNIENNI